MSSFTGVQTIYVDHEAVSRLHKEGILTVQELEDYVLPDDSDQECSWSQYPNIFLVLTSTNLVGAKATAIGRLLGDSTVVLLKEMPVTITNSFESRNKEQLMLMNTLFDENVRAQVVVGAAGCGKTLCALAYAFEQIMGKGKKKYQKVILTRPTSSVGKDMGAFPGTAEEKLGPYLGNYYDNIEFLLGRNGRAFLEEMMNKGTLEILPLQLIGGASWHDAIVIADEVQSLTPEQMYALGTRPAKGTKLIMLGDFRQRYGHKCPVTETGLWQVVNSEKSKKSPIFATIQLLKQERSELSKLFAEIFDSKEDV